MSKELKAVLRPVYAGAGDLPRDAVMTSPGIFVYEDKPRTVVPRLVGFDVLVDGHFVYHIWMGHLTKEAKNRIGGDNDSMVHESGKG